MRVLWIGASLLHFLPMILVPIHNPTDGNLDQAEKWHGVMTSEHVSGIGTLIVICFTHEYVEC